MREPSRFVRRILLINSIEASTLGMLMIIFSSGYNWGEPPIIIGLKAIIIVYKKLEKFITISSISLIDEDFNYSKN